MSGLIVILGGLLVSLVHGVLPNHWLPFVLIGRAQSWELGKVFKTLATAGIAHMAVSGGIAMVILLFGVVLQPYIETIGHILSGIILLTAGIIYMIMDMTQKTHHHHEIHEEARRGMSDKNASLTLILSLALSPCEALIPVFVSAAAMVDMITLLILVVLSGVVTISAMALLSFLAWKGLAHMDFGRWASKERTIIGVTLIFTGILTVGVLLEG